MLLGVALNGGAVNQLAVVLCAGNYTVGGTIAVGVFYYVSNTAGGIAPIADLGSGDYVSIIGYGVTTAIMKIAPVATGLTLA